MIDDAVAQLHHALDGLEELYRLFHIEIFLDPQTDKDGKIVIESLGKTPTIKVFINDTTLLANKTANLIDSLYFLFKQRMAHEERLMSQLIHDIHEDLVGQGVTDNGLLSAQEIFAHIFETGIADLIKDDDSNIHPTCARDTSLYIHVSADSKGEYPSPEFLYAVEWFEWRPRWHRAIQNIIDTILSESARFNALQ